MPRRPIIRFLGTASAPSGDTPWYYSKQTHVVGEMLKNVASQVVGIQMVTAADGSAFTGSVTCYVTGDAGTQAAGSVGSGACTSEGNGYHTYAPAQAETNYNQIAFTFTGSGAIPATLIVYTDASYDRIGAPVAASISADIADVEGKVDDLEGRLTATRAGYLDNLNGLTAAAVADAVWDEASAGHVSAGSFGELVQDIDNEVDYIHSVIDSIAITGSALSKEASSNTLTVGTESSGTYASTAIDNGVYHVLTAASNEIDVYYEFNIGTSGVPAKVNIAGYLKEGAPAGGDTINLYAYQWGVGWELLQTAIFTGITTDGPDVNHTIALLNRHVGTGADDGKVRIRFQAASLEAGTTLNLDYLVVEYAESIAADVASILADTGTDGVVVAAASKTGYALADSTSDAVIADAVWNAATATYGTSGSYGEALEAVGASADPWLTNLPGAYGAGTAGYLIGTNINAPIGTVDTVVDAIKAKTDNLPASPAAVGSAMTLESGAITAAVIATGAIDADALAADAAAEIADAVWDEAATGHTDAGKAGAQLWTDIDAILADTGTDGVVVASIAANAVTASALATDAVNEIADGVLNRDMSTGSDSGSATVRTPRQALRFLRNKWSVSGTTLTVTKEDDSTPSWTAEVTTDAAANPITASDPASS